MTILSSSWFYAKTKHEQNVVTFVLQYIISKSWKMDEQKKNQRRGLFGSESNLHCWLPLPTHNWTTMHFTEQGFIGLPGIIITSKFTEHYPHLPVSKHHRDMSSLDQCNGRPASCTNHRPPLLSADSGLVVSQSLLMTQFKFDHPHTRGQRTRVHNLKWIDTERRLCLSN